MPKWYYPNLNLFQYYKIVLEKLKLTIEEPFELDDRCVRKSYVELDVALREALANMIIHADYLDNETNITVTVENFFYTFLNPGTMRISSTQFFSGGKSVPRNNTLILFFRRMGACERAGSGGKEICNVVEKNKFRYPELIVNPSSTYLKLWTATLENSYPELNENERKILLYIQKERSVQFADIKENLKITEYNIRKSLNELLGKHLIIKKGKGRATVYLWNLSKIEQLATVDFLKDFIFEKN